jgi:hypothetical protein
MQLSELLTDNWSAKTLVAYVLDNFCWIQFGVHDCIQ